MSKTYELITDSLNEILTDLQETGGKNLKCETLTAEVATPKKSETCEKESARVRLKKFLTNTDS